MDAQPTDECVQAWVERTAAVLRSAGDERVAIIEVFERFLDEGLALVHSPSALWDYVGMALRRAGFDASQRDRRMRIYSTVTNRRFHGGRPYPPDWPWHEPKDAEPGGSADRPRK